jgi:hypothetical protein
MAEDFAVVADELHCLMATLSRKDPLKPVFIEIGEDGYEHQSNEDGPGKRLIDIMHNITDLEPIVPARYYEILNLHDKLRTESMLYYLHWFYDSRRTDFRCKSQNKTVIRHVPTSMFTIDLLNYGVGVFRSVKDNPNLLLSFLGTPSGKLVPKGTKVYSESIRQTLYNPETKQWDPERWESTNIIYGDAYGELQQLSDRRDDTQILEYVCKILTLCTDNPKSVYVRYEEEEFEEPEIGDSLEDRKFRVESIVDQFHIECQAIWRQPPKNAKELIERVDFILERCTLDHNPMPDVTVNKKRTQENPTTNYLYNFTPD